MLPESATAAEDERVRDAIVRGSRGRVGAREGTKVRGFEEETVREC